MKRLPSKPHWLGHFITHPGSHHCKGPATGQVGTAAFRDRPPAFHRCLPVGEATGWSVGGTCCAARYRRARGMSCWVASDFGHLPHLMSSKRSVTNRIVPEHVLQTTSRDFLCWVNPSHLWSGVRVASILVFSKDSGVCKLSAKHNSLSSVDLAASGNSGLIGSKIHISAFLLICKALLQHISNASIFPTVGFLPQPVPTFELCN